jgi:putative aldouronate transport system substrate-binding protein
MNKLTNILGGTGMNKKWLLAGTNLMTASVLVFSGCAGGSVESEKKTQKAEIQFPLEKSVQLKMFANTAPQVKKDYNEMLLFKNLQKQTNVQVNWTLVSQEQVLEKKNIMIASGDLPDAFYGRGVLTDQEVVSLGSQGAIIPLEGLIEAYAPNLKKVLEKRPELKKLITAPDGHMYSLPLLIERQMNTIPSVLFINKKWLDKLGLPMPTTLDEFYTALKAFKDKDPNGNGKNDEIPFSFLFNNSSMGSNSMVGSFGVKMDPPQSHLYLDNGKLKYAPAQPEYEAYLQYLSKLFKEKLLDQEVFTHSQNAFTTKIIDKEEVLGAFFGFTESSYFGTPSEDYAPVMPLKGVSGEQGGWLRVPSAISVGSFAITNKNKNPEVTMKWMDMMYEPKLSFQFNAGPFGVTLKENPDGSIEKLSPPKDVGLEIFKHTEGPGNGATVIMLKDIVDKFIDPQADEKWEYYNLYDKYASKEMIPSMLWSLEDVEKERQFGMDLHAKNAYYDSTFAKFVMNGFTHADWENHLNQLKKLKIDDYVMLNQKYYDAFIGKK